MSQAPQHQDQQKQRYVLQRALEQYWATRPITPPWRRYVFDGVLLIVIGGLIVALAMDRVVFGMIALLALTAFFAYNEWQALKFQRYLTSLFRERFREAYRDDTLEALLLKNPQLRRRLDDAQALTVDSTMRPPNVAQWQHYVAQFPDLFAQRMKTDGALGALVLIQDLQHPHTS